MNKDDFERKWEEIRGLARHWWWDKLTDDDLERVDGQLEKLFGVLQAKYGYTREAAEEAFNHRMAEYETNQKKFAVPAK